jgi:hypothetical protein
VLLRKAADQAGLTAGLSAAFRRKGTSLPLDRAVAGHDTAYTLNPG